MVSISLLDDREHGIGKVIEVMTWSRIQFSFIPLTLSFVLSFGTALAGKPNSTSQSPSLRGADVLHGTVQASINLNNELVLALDRKVSSFDAEDGIIDLVVVVAPTERARTEDIVMAFRQPRSDATLEFVENGVRISTPRSGSYRLQMPESEAPSRHNASDSEDYVPIIGIARHVTREQELSFPETIQEFDTFRLMREESNVQGKNPNSISPKLAEDNAEEKSWSCTTGGPGSRSCSIGCPLGFECSVACWIGYYACCSCYTGCQCVPNGTSPP